MGGPTDLVGRADGRSPRVLGGWARARTPHDPLYCRGPTRKCQILGLEAGPMLETLIPTRLSLFIVPLSLKIKQVIIFNPGSNEAC